MPKAKVTKKKSIGYDTVMWNGIIPVYRCTVCGAQKDDESDMILHVVDHTAPDDQEAKLDELTTNLSKGIQHE